MKQYILIIVILIIGLQDIFAQTDNDTTLIQNPTSQGYSLSGKGLKEVLLANDEASPVYKSALRSRRLSGVLLISGGFALASGRILESDDRIYKVAGGFFLLSSIISIANYHKRTNEAIEIYNNSIKQKNCPEQTVSIVLSSDGIGVQFNF